MFIVHTCACWSRETGKFSTYCNGYYCKNPGGGGGDGHSLITVCWHCLGASNFVHINVPCGTLDLMFLWWSMMNLVTEEF